MLVTVTVAAARWGRGVHGVVSAAEGECHWSFVRWRGAIFWARGKGKGKERKGVRWMEARMVMINRTVSSIDGWMMLPKKSLNK